MKRWYTKKDQRDVAERAYRALERQAAGEELSPDEKQIAELLVTTFNRDGSKKPKPKEGPPQVMALPCPALNLL